MYLLPSGLVLILNDEIHNSLRCYRTPWIARLFNYQRCPVASFEKYVSKLDKSIDVLFQQPKKNIHPKYKEIWYHKKVVYTNHCLRKTMATGMKKSNKNYSILEIAAVIGRRNYQSLKAYLEEPDEEERIDFCDSLLKYTGANENEDSSDEDAQDFNLPPPPKKKKTAIKKKEQTESNFN